jgi:hypothetical protein
MQTLPRSVLLRLAIALISCALAACRDPAAPEDDATKKWARTRPTAYAFTLGVSCFCAEGPSNRVRISVRGDSVVSRVIAATGEPRIFPTGEYGPFQPIDSLLARIRDARARNAAELRTEFDSQYGYPAKVWIDYSRMIADEEIGWTITEFERLP